MSHYYPLNQMTYSNQTNERNIPVNNRIGPEKNNIQTWWTYFIGKYQKFTIKQIEEYQLIIIFRKLSIWILISNSIIVMANFIQNKSMYKNWKTSKYRQYLTHQLEFYLGAMVCPLDVTMAKLQVQGLNGAEDPYIKKVSLVLWILLLETKVLKIYIKVYFQSY